MTFLLGHASGRTSFEWKSIKMTRGSRPYELAQWDNWAQLRVSKAMKHQSHFYGIPLSLHVPSLSALMSYVNKGASFQKKETTIFHVRELRNAAGIWAKLPFEHEKQCETGNLRAIIGRELAQCKPHLISAVHLKWSHTHTWTTNRFRWRQTMFHLERIQAVRWQGWADGSESECTIGQWTH